VLKYPQRTSDSDGLDPRPVTSEALGVVGHGVPDCQRKLRFLAALSSFDTLDPTGWFHEALGALDRSPSLSRKSEICWIPKSPQAILRTPLTPLRCLRQERRVERASPFESARIGDAECSPHLPARSVVCSACSQRSHASHVSTGRSLVAGRASNARGPNERPQGVSEAAGEGEAVVRSGGTERGRPAAGSRTTQAPQRSEERSESCDRSRPGAFRADTGGSRESQTTESSRPGAFRADTGGLHVTVTDKRVDKQKDRNAECAEKFSGRPSIAETWISDSRARRPW
jgi:hypothetical protein